MNFEETVKNMTAGQVVDTMCKALRNPVTEINMQSFGYRTGDNICMGCAATNTICRIANIEPLEVFTAGENVATAYLAPTYFVSMFEHAVDSLRRGWMDTYNERLNEIGGRLIPTSFLTRKLPYLDTYNYLERLPVYEEFAKELLALEGATALPDSQEWVMKQLQPIFEQVKDKELI